MMHIENTKRKWKKALKRWNKLLALILAIHCSLYQTYAYFTTSSKVESKIKTLGYNFTLNGNGGTFDSENITIINNSTILPIPTKLGYNFLGYSNILNGEINYSNNINNVNEINNKEIFANWESTTYSITYNLDNGTIFNQKTEYNVEETFTLPNPTKTGHTFLGWTGSNGTTPQKDLSVQKGTTGNLVFNANWETHLFEVDVNPIIQNTTYNGGVNSFTFSVWLNGEQVADRVTDYYNDAVPYGSTIRVYVYDRDGYNITSFRDKTWTITDSLIINPSWYDIIPPTITTFNVTNLGLHANQGTETGWDIRIYVEGYDSGSGIQKYQTWLVPYGNGSGSPRKDGNDRTMTDVINLNTASGRTFCAYAIDNAGNEAEQCKTIRVN